MADYHGEERRHVDYRVFESTEAMVRDHEKAITTLVNAIQTMTSSMATFEKQFDKIATTLEKLADIDKHILQSTFLFDDLKKRITMLEQSHDGSGCHALRGALIQCKSNKESLEKEMVIIDDRVSKIEKGAWKIITSILSAIGLAILGLVMKTKGA